MAKKDDLAHALSAKAAGVKDAAAKLRPKGHSSTLQSAADSARDAAAQALVPFARQVGTAAGKAAAEKAPDLLRKEVIPRFIEAFEKAG
jgi:hypothetical protein